MSNTAVFNVHSLFTLMLCIHLVSCDLPREQITTMIKIYKIFENNTGSSFVWKNVAKNSNPCSWEGVNCSSGNSSITINHLSFNTFSISSSEILPLLCSITSLESLDVSNNHLSSIPKQFYTNCGKISGLKTMNFSRNLLSGYLPTLYGFRTLKFLDFSQNSLGGEIKLQLNWLGSLTTLNLNHNRFIGTIPTNLGKMNHLEELRLSGNIFKGEIPVEITKYRNLSVIDFSNNALSGSIPEEFGELTRLVSISLSSNNLGGVIPKSLSGISTLRMLAADLNQISGSIPSGLTSYLQALHLSYNKLTGAIPLNLLSGPNLLFLDLTHNHLQGPIPARISTKLIRLRLGSNSLNGTIPSESFENLGELMYLELDNNSLSGELPLGLGRCRKLSLLNLAHNSLTGKLPSVLGSLTNLEVLSLEFNSFSGEIPPQISLIGRLLKLNLSSNSLNGSLPSSMSILKKLFSLDLRSNNLRGPIPESIRNLSSLMELQLGKNELSGRIPDLPLNLQIALNLSYNLFTGPIPDNLARLGGLDVLDLSNNMFSGNIPNSLGELKTLSVLLLSNNQLSGIVPKFGALVVFDISGNPNLISHGETERSEKERGSISFNLDFVIAYASGIPVGLLISLAVSILRKYNRMYCNLIAPSTIYKANIDFKRAMEAVAKSSNITFKTRFSTYFKAIMPTGTTYLVKKVSRSNKMFRLYSHEKLGEKLEDLGNLCNPNVMIPVAYVLTVQSAYFLYDYSPKCTLSYILHRRKGDSLDWASRYKIVIGVSQGLEFLHECHSGPILLLDLSSETILLKSLTKPQIGDIELCKLGKPTIAGSAGYIPPEYGETRRVTAAGNVYSLGVVLLELVTGKEAVSEGSELAKWVLINSLHQHKWEHILDVNVSTTSVAVKRQMLTVLEVALACVSFLPESRPNMVTVLQMLKAPAPRRQC